MGIVDELHKDNFSITLDGHSLNVVAKENIHVRAKVLVNLTLIGSSHNRQPTKTRLSYICVTRPPSSKTNDMTYHTNQS